ncbi:MAG: hypothetical protein RDU76_06130 [Candidatus Edwardsbacteria bacterium]|nr:hypothetical protein [Candidatus Edwardsbacteria bacterium]
MKRLNLIIALAVITALFSACSQTDPVAPVVPVGTNAYITDLSPSLAWVDLSANTVSLAISRTDHGTVVGDTISLTVTAYKITSDSTGTFINTAVWPYRSGDWTWSIPDTLDVYKNSDRLLISATWWNSGWPKQTVDLSTDVRVGLK